ncbi:NADH:ubiquinone oxidoreductase 17.2 kDa subunit (macronuclear) [Tetrahymena thermophila SB210]|uniref:NADH dehydrogenase [ubiquinone] 1 alpha subcomplex subunit 12 n=1 Tax=Tetrahymena thermophila (strain SB210) TaxID=312017 RepID=A4VDQ6_TETTS|nr:NADH:ubiquinone oxidoreductase 17.2 kDa subunit [Tetrahymena thermophila SB210]7TGH_AL Chain AL, NADH dehydrogenase [ubiquinone] 1 alpha subcomplex subunit 12 [Tetrahymena thermophila]8B6F_AP Chain AP, NADH dehydrogenase [ubiquinone] 1 alpha subcomplex subunit 12 [Tetrahymena thermophila SB210]8BQS_AP Chain AP, NADH dehydrogenase [ubiquinone] 1 alpha subcomplex subunit 12 [Tetrahymena thermophila SB210]8GYM_AL Chain AL, NADH dehydrogenase [ubiquinone] 1 alpha subcomplex subunit 12 [Tetrahyme|eukprot:XP_001471372.1 NADH:ubiquinone oxidoreductase 17.2 kDa subunit [Tetrahymena thermophila SB210]
MGLWSWTINQMLTPKFWVHLRREGFIKTWTRGHKASRHAHYVGGNRTDGYTKQVGEDEFGNRYYEDFDVDHKNQRRWVEFSDYFMQMWSNGDKVPVGWHGWLSHQYDDFPTRTGNSAFVKHHYLKQHTANLSNTPLNHVPQGAPQNLNRMRFITAQRDRSRAPWQSPKGEGVFQGKKLIVASNSPFIDDMSIRD